MNAFPQKPQTHDGGDPPAVAAAPLLFSVTRGNPSPEEIAALTAVLASSLGAAAPEVAPAAPTRRERIRQATLRPRHMIAQRRGRA